MNKNDFTLQWPVVAVTLACLILLLHACSRSAVYSPPAEPPPPTMPGQPRPYKVWGQWYQPIASADGFRQSGIASWYGKKFHGRKTSNGEIYNMYDMTAAHKTLPFNTYVKVHNLENGRQTIVRINDRGPFIRGRIIDLSYKAADGLGIVGPGTARVNVIALGQRNPKAGDSSKKQYIPVDYTKGNFTFQIGAFVDRQNAERLRSKLAQKYENAHITVYENGPETFFRVRVGRYSTLAQARQGESLLVQDGYEPMIVAE
jgi:rare lipoprotein A